MHSSSGTMNMNAPTDIAGPTRRSVDLFLLNRSIIFRSTASCMQALASLNLTDRQPDTVFCTVWL